MDKVQANAIADALLQNAATVRSPSRCAALRLPQSRGEWLVLSSFALLGLAISFGIGLTLGAPWNGIFLIGQVVCPLGIMLGHLVNTVRRMRVMRAHQNCLHQSLTQLASP